MSIYDRLILIIFFLFFLNINSQNSFDITGLLPELQNIVTGYLDDYEEYLVLPKSCSDWFAISNDNRFLATTSPNYPDLNPIQKSEIEVWDLYSRRLIKTIKCKQYYCILHLGFSDDNQTISALVGLGYGIINFDIKTGKEKNLGSEEVKEFQQKYPRIPNDEYIKGYRAISNDGLFKVKIEETITHEVILGDIIERKTIKAVVFINQKKELESYNSGMNEHKNKNYFDCAIQ